MLSVFDTLQNASNQWPEKIAMHDAFGATTYSDLLAEALALSAFLEENQVAKGQCLGFCTGNNRRFLAALYGALHRKVLVMPVAYQLKPAELAGAIKDAQVHWLLTDDANKATMYPLIAQTSLGNTDWFLCRTPRRLDECTAIFVPDAAFMRFTSGTTGNAKGVILSHTTVLQRIAAANEGLALGENDSVLWVLPMAYHFVVSLVLYIRYGVTIVVNEYFMAADVMQAISGFGCTLMYAAPMHIKLMALHKTAVALPTLRKVISTTTSIDPAVCRTFEDKFHIPVSQAYGIIEIGLPIINFQKSTAYPEAVGYALPAYEAAVLNDRFEPLPPNVVGLLGIRGPGMFDGYLTPPATKNEVLQNGWFITGDYATKHEDGLILIKGRAKNMINVAGNKVFPEEIETVVCRYNGISAARAYSHQHRLLGEVVALSVVPEANVVIDKEALIQYCRQQLSDFKLPQIIDIVADLPMTQTGKIRRG